MNIMFEKTYKEIELTLAKRLAGIRKRRKITQRKLAEISGVSFASIKRFEQTGEISLQSFVKIAIALDLEKELDSLFEEVHYLTIEEVINENR